MNRRLEWANKYTDQKLRYKVMPLPNVEMVAKYSFIAHKSINYLDLNLREFSSLREKRKILVRLLFCSADPAYSKKFVSTAESCRKTMVLERRWLYVLHLDLPKGREKHFIGLSRNDFGKCWQPKTMCFNDLTVCDSLYQKSFRRFVEEALKQNGLEMTFVRRHMALMKNILGFRVFEVNSIEDRILDFLFTEGAETEIVLEFLAILDFNSLVLTTPKHTVLEYLLHHAYSGRFNLMLNDRRGILVNECFFTSRFRIVELLLKYQNAPYYYIYDCSVLVPSWMRDNPDDWYPEDLEAPFERGIISQRRYSLWLQIFYAYVASNRFTHHGSVTSALLLIWRTLPDAFFTLKEVEEAYEEEVPFILETIRKAHEFYVKTMAGDLVLDKPRPLQHYCRVAIRKSLCYNLQLPSGIAQLRLPRQLKAYLRLEK